MIPYSERIPIKTRSEVAAMAVAARHVAEILLELREMAKPGVSTGELENRAAALIGKRSLTSSFKGYGPHGAPKYPACLCTSVNEEVVHGIPGDRVLVEGDILSIDFGVACDGFHGDSAVTIAVGGIAPEAAALLEATRAALYEGIAQMVPGNRLSDIGHAVQRRAEGAGCSVVRQFVGHGIGRELHEPPQVPNFGEPGKGPRLREGMVLAIEPMVNQGSPEVELLDDEWTAVTADRQLSAHFEHTVAIGADGPVILTKVAGSH